MTPLAFTASTPFLRPSRLSPLALSPLSHARLSTLHRVPARMAASEPGSEPGSESKPEPTEASGDNSASEILKTLRETSAADNSPSKRSMLGVYRDVDGKSNVWAVEPKEETDTKPQISKTTLIVAAAAFIVVALLVLPLLPFTNPDQV